MYNNISNNCGVYSMRDFPDNFFHTEDKAHVIVFHLITISFRTSDCVNVYYTLRDQLILSKLLPSLALENFRALCLSVYNINMF